MPRCFGQKPYTQVPALAPVLVPIFLMKEILFLQIIQIIIIWHCSSILPLGADAGASTSNRARGAGASTSNRARTSISNRARASTRDEARANIKIIWLSVPTTSKELVLALGKSLVLALAPGSQGKSKSFCVRASKKYLQNPT